MKIFEDFRGGTGDKIGGGKGKITKASGGKEGKGSELGKAEKILARKRDTRSQGRKGLWGGKGGKDLNKERERS